MAPKSSTAKDPDIHKVERLQVPYSTNAPASLDITVPPSLATVFRYVSNPKATPPTATVEATGILPPEAIAVAKNLSPIPAWAAAVDRIDARPQRFFTHGQRSLGDGLQ